MQFLHDHWLLMSVSAVAVLLIGILRCGARRDSQELTTAAAAGDVGKVGRLLAAGADVAVTDSVGMSPLLAASNGGHVDVVLLLLEHGADVNAVYSGGMAALQAAVHGLPPFGSNSQEKVLATIELLLSRGADIKARDGIGATVLHDAALFGHASVVAVLIKRGADVGAVDKTGRTALHRAAQENHADVARVLLEHGADVNVRDNEGQTPFDTAIALDRKAAIDVFRVHGSN